MFMWKSLKVMGAADGDGAEGELLAISFHRAEDNTSFNTVKKKKKHAEKPERHTSSSSTQRRSNNNLTLTLLYHIVSWETRSPVFLT